MRIGVIIMMARYGRGYGRRARGMGGRPFKMKLVRSMPEVTFFKPRGIPMSDLETMELSIEETEALRLVDMEGLEQEEAAKKMKISRKTLWRLLHDARKKLTTALIEGKAIEIKGGYYMLKK